MPTITVNKNVFENLVGKKLPLDQLKDRISYLGTDLEAVEGDEIIVEIFPNRPDMLSEQGFARAFSSFIGIKSGLRKYDVKPSGEKVIIEDSVKEVRPFTACAIVKGLRFDDEKIREIIQVQEKLHITYGRNRKKVAIGVYPYEKIKPPIRFLAEDPNKIKFQPLEFPKEITALQVLSQHPTGREYGYLLEGKSKFPFFIDSNNQVLSMPPIINSHDVGKITEKTTDVFIECSGFDYNVLSKCLNIIVTALADMGGQIYSMEIERENKKINSPNLEPEAMNIDISYINKILGLNLRESEIKKYLERMGYGYEKGKAYIPSYRADILHQIDLGEDIAIAYGYENFKEEIPEVATIAEQSHIQQFIRKIADLLSGLGYLETNSYSLISKLELSRMKVDYPAIELSNANEDFNCLRNWITPSLLKILSENRHHDYPQKIFETGTCFKKDESKETNTDEFYRLALLTTHKDADFTESKQALDYLMNALNLNYEIEETEHNSFIEGRVGRITVSRKKIAYIGEIHPEVLQNWSLEMPIAGFEINITELYNIINEKGGE
ncbi:phenylalanine--tRNA ligase subunit beta [Candidatus Woesearchaeota archaeon]|nr:phenylalanine--tRNA ligase subunit beta [Candidatus Woesearchaeota archaeon]